MQPNQRFSHWVAFRDARLRMQRGLISRTAFCVYLAMLDGEKRVHDRVIATYKWIAARVRSAKGTAIEAVKQLEAAGMLLVVPRRAQTGWASRVVANAYVLLQPPPLPKQPRRLPEFGAVLPALARRVRAAFSESSNRTALESVQNQTLASSTPPDWRDALLARVAATEALREKEAREEEERAAASLRSRDG